MMNRQSLLILMVAGCLIPLTTAILAQEEETDDDPLSAVFGGGFENMQCEQFHLSPQGDADFIGRVKLKMADISLECNRLTVDSDTRIMRAIGTPVKIMMGTERATCRKFTYDIDKKESRLEENPVVYRTQGEKTTKIQGDTIILTQDKDGKTGVHVSMDKRDPGKLSEITVIENNGNKEKAAANKKKNGRKINGKTDLKLIKTPTIE